MAVRTGRERTWLIVNAAIWTYLALLFASLFTPKSFAVCGWDVEPQVFASAFMGWMFNRTVDVAKKVLGEFKPGSALEAKRVNEQIKSLSTAINGAAGAAVSVFAFSQIAKDFQNPNWMLIIFAVGLAFYAHMGARGLLGMLKDESEKAYSSIED